MGVRAAEARVSLWVAAGRRPEPIPDRELRELRNCGSGAGTPGTPSGTDASGTSTAASGLGTSPGGQTFGGAGIIGFSPASPKQSILVYKKKNHYNEWEFLYSPLSDQKANATGITGGTGIWIGWNRRNRRRGRRVEPGNKYPIDAYSADSANGSNGSYFIDATPVRRQHRYRSKCKKAHPLEGWAFAGARQGKRPERAERRSLDAEGRTAAAGRLDLGIFELETGRFQGFHVVHSAAVQIHQ